MILICFKKLQRTVTPDLKAVTSLEIKNENFDWLPQLQSLMAKSADKSSTNRIYLTSQNDPTNGVVGLVKCLRREPGGENIRCIFDPSGKLNLNFQQPDAGLTEILQKDLTINIMKDGKLGSYRHLPLSQDPTIPSKEVEHAYVNTLTTGDLTSLRWIESPNKFEGQLKNKSNKKLIKVNYASMNFRDIMLATGRIPIDPDTTYGDCVLGLEFSGIDEEGNRVMTCVDRKGLATTVLAEPDLCWTIPDHWTLEEAATVPAVYATS